MHHQLLRSSWQSTGYIQSLSVWSAIDPSLQDSGPSLGVAGTLGSPARCLLCRPLDRRGSEVRVVQFVWETLQVLVQAGL